MLSKKEIALINYKIADYRKLAKKATAEASRTSIKDEKYYYYLQARINDSAADALKLLLGELIPH